MHYKLMIDVAYKYVTNENSENSYSNTLYKIYITK